MNQPAIRLENVRLPLAHFDLQIDVVIHGRVTAVFGPSGRGENEFAGPAGRFAPDAPGPSPDRRTGAQRRAAGLFVPPEQRRIGYVPQDGALFPHLSVRNNLLYGQRRNEAPAKFSLDGILDVLEIRPLLARPTFRGFPAGNASAWRSPGRCSRGRNCCSWTSRWQVWTRI